MNDNLDEAFRIVKALRQRGVNTTEQAALYLAIAIEGPTELNALVKSLTTASGGFSADLADLEKVKKEMLKCVQMLDDAISQMKLPKETQ